MQRYFTVVAAALPSGVTARGCGGGDGGYGAGSLDIESSNGREECVSSLLVTGFERVRGHRGCSVDCGHENEVLSHTGVAHSGTSLAHHAWTPRVHRK